jgi:hypothetical protein
MENFQNQNQVHPMTLEEQDAFFKKKEQEYDEKDEKEEEWMSSATMPAFPPNAYESTIGIKSEHDIKKENNERIERLISPELLKYFSRNEAHNLIKSFLGIPSVTTQEEGCGYQLSNIKNEYLTLLRSEIEGKKIIEIGDAGHGINRSWFKEMGAEGFVGIDINYGGPDALTFLMKQPADSAVVCSFGVFDDGSLYFSEDSNLKKYIQKLCEEIYRVTPRNSISLHGLERKNDLIRAGFIEVAQITPVTFMGGSVILFRKQ